MLKASICILFLLASFLSQAQSFIPFYDTVYGLYVSLPSSWATEYRYRRNDEKSDYYFFTSERRIGEDYKGAIDFVMWHASNPAIFITDEWHNGNPFFKAFTTQKNPTLNLLSEQYSDTYYSYDTFVDNRYTFYRYGYESSLMEMVSAGIVHNNDVFTIRFTCPLDSYAIYKPIFLAVMNSIYFDK